MGDVFLTDKPPELAVKERVETVAPQVAEARSISLQMEITGVAEFGAAQGALRNGRLIKVAQDRSAIQEVKGAVVISNRLPMPP